MATQAEWAWVAGIFEGEGTLGVNVKGNGRGGQALRRADLKINMSDRDVINRLQLVTGVGTVRPHKVVPGRKPQWAWRVKRISDLQLVLTEILPWLGARRRERALEVLEWLAEAPGTGKRRPPSHFKVLPTIPIFSP